MNIAEPKENIMCSEIPVYEIFMQAVTLKINSKKNMMNISVPCKNLFFP